MPMRSRFRGWSQDPTAAKDYVRCASWVEQVAHDAEYESYDEGSRWDNGFSWPMLLADLGG